MSKATAADSPDKIGRFELRQRLGHGAQATVWMAYDPRLDREVAVKMMHSGADQDSVDRWLQEARLVGRLNHPHIVPVYEADVQDNRPYLVFEFVPGRTLAQHLRARGKLPVREAVELMLGVLDALQAAHTAGVVHRDLKPSNILVDGKGRARVMDFGIAGRIQDTQAQQVVGTPGYMSPEATHGDKPAPAMDLFSAGLVLAEMLCGEQLIAEKDPYRAIYRVAHEDLKLPDSMPPDVDDNLRAIMLRCMSRDPSKRHADVGALREALQLWLSPPAQAVQPPVESNGTLDFLLRRMRHKSDFPAMSDAVGRIQSVANSDKETVSNLSNEILKDVALTNKLLRLVNTARYTTAGGGSINTVSRAVALIGFAGIRNMALSLVLLEHMSDKGHASLMTDEFIRSLMSASLAGELCKDPREGEEAFLGAMFHNLGRLLTEFYFPEEAMKVRSLVKESQKAWSAGKRHTVAPDHAASIHVLGISFQDLGLGVAKAWGLPEALQRTMKRPSGEPPSRPCEKADQLRWAAVAAIDLTDAMLLPEESIEPALEAVMMRYARVLDTSATEIEKAMARAQERMIELTQAMNLHVSHRSGVWRLIDRPIRSKDAQASQYHLAEHELQATMPYEDHVTITEAGERFTPAEVAAMLAAGIQDITNTMVEDFQLNEVLRMILETMLRALGFRRIVFCLRDPKTNTLTGRFGLGKDVEAVVASFRVPLKPKDGKVDLFGAVCLKGADTLIADATVPTIGQRLPAWYIQSVNAPSFLLLPLVMKGSPFALIYADKSRPGGIDLNEKSLSLLRTLRNQAVMAFKQSS